MPLVGIFSFFSERSYFNQPGDRVLRARFRSYRAELIFVNAVRKKFHKLFWFRICRNIPVLWFDRLTINGFKQKVADASADKIGLKSGFGQFILNKFYFFWNFHSYGLMILDPIPMIIPNAILENFIQKRARRRNGASALRGGATKLWIKFAISLRVAV